MRRQRLRRRPLSASAHDPSIGAVPTAPHRCPGVEIRGEGLTIGLDLVDGTIVLRLAGALDRQGRATLLRVARRAARSSSGHVVIDGAGIETHDDAGIDALASIVQLSGVRSVHLRHIGADLGRRLAEAGLAERLHVPVGPVVEAVPDPYERATDGGRW